MLSINYTASQIVAVPFWLEGCYYLDMTNGVKDGFSLQQKVLTMHQELT
jgi:hypothetical protein